MGSPVASEAVRDLLEGYSAEVTTPDRRSLDTAAKMMPANAPVYVASLPRDTPESQLDVARMLKELGLQPVPHIVARNIPDRRSFEKIIYDLSRYAGVDRALILGGDRDRPVGDYHSSLQLLKSGILEDHGIKRVAVGCYPEGHPAIADDILETALFEKIDTASRGGIDLRLITQLCFDADAICGYLAALRSKGVTSKIRVGIAGPAKTPTLLKYAAICGVGPSLKALKKQRKITRGLLKTQTPATLLRNIAEQNRRNALLDITGVHFFTFASLSGTIDWAEKQLGRGS
ncbi:methylenetetrahydrofolate reductase (NADPH) [Parasphingorhabdus marina DSM 22363]|uniref:Methylenetetrahydrofolate reductase n=1 Tax=Parasphingorhabdus marina DSM 22363 TaxID=1123272 RepID=A0A1N6D3K7_9SPHN|nr:methylenetetrahydrofolate reductase [Parasphingorhabdus marina]SIN65402.1 methylenetetrahydrofolate reductase (NADPH) [Parasphingorhabdus marina DSM 22363]